MCLDVPMVGHHESSCMMSAQPLKIHFVEGTAVFNVAKKIYVGPRNEVLYTGHS